MQNAKCSMQNAKQEAPIEHFAFIILHFAFSEHMTRSYDTIIGLEVHVQLSTTSKLFCRCSTKFGAEPNTQTCPVCIGMPGTLPVMNREAFRLSLKTALALNCEIPAFTKWDRKQYYYPD